MVSDFTLYTVKVGRITPNNYDEMIHLAVKGKCLKYELEGFKRILNTMAEVVVRNNKAKEFVKASKMNLNRKRHYEIFFSYYFLWSSGTYNSRCI